MADAEPTPAPTTMPDNRSDWSPVWTTAAIAAAQVIDDLNRPKSPIQPRDFFGRKGQNQRPRARFHTFKCMVFSGVRVCKSRPRQMLPRPTICGRHAAAVHACCGRRGTTEQNTKQRVDPTESGCDLFRVTALRGKSGDRSVTD